MRYTWRGVLCNKSPFDLALYSLLIWREKPQTVIEIGTKEGGSALWMYDLTRSFGLRTQIVTVDIRQHAGSDRSDVMFLQGDARNLGAVLTDGMMKDLQHPLLAIDDSAHRPDTVLAFLRFMDRWLAPGEYAVVEDGICNSMGGAAMFKGGPIPAIRQFLDETDGRYAIDEELCDFFGYNVTFNPNGYLRKLR